MMIHLQRFEFLVVLTAVPLLTNRAESGLFPAHLIGIAAEESQAIPCGANDQLSAAVEFEAQRAETSLSGAAESANFGDWRANVISPHLAFSETLEVTSRGRLAGCDECPVEADLHGGGVCGHH